MYKEKKSVVSRCHSASLNLLLKIQKVIFGHNIRELKKIILNKLNYIC